ncbi:MAG: hypothetical protein HY209_02690 [Candidatus Omnitrophica bacterium]|nr:hypothetical protein [Candidatus Omnitrophota bacterium]
MNKIVLSVGILLLAGALSGCETVKGAQKDIHNLGTATCKAGQAVVDSFAEGDAQKPRGAMRKADDWMQKNLW